MVAKKDRVGETYPTNKYGIVRIERYVNCEDVDIVFLDTGYRANYSMVQIMSGAVKDRLQPSVYGVGILGVDSNCYQDNAYTHWCSMLERCFSEKVNKRLRAYNDVSVSDNFKYYSSFKEWCNKQVGFGNEGWQLDKDIIMKGSRVYSEETCCFVPHEINNLLNKQTYGESRDLPVGVCYDKGRKKFVARLSKKSITKNLGGFKTCEEAFYAYKEAKETYIKEVANKWKDQIDTRVYEALMKYEVDIND